MSVGIGKPREIVSVGGIKAWFLEDYTVPVVSLKFAFRGGSTQDPEGREGAVRVLAGTLDEGAEGLDSQAFQRALYEKAIELHFGADKDTISGSMRTLSRHLDRAQDLLALAVNTPTFDEEPFERVREQLKASLRHQANNPDYRVLKAFTERVFAGHSYARPSEGRMETLDALVRSEVSGLHRKVFARDVLQIALVGALDEARAVRLLDGVFGPLPAQAELVATGAAPFLGLGGEEIVDLDVPQTTIRFGRPAPSREDENYIPAFVLTHILGGGTGLSSRLFREVREKRGLSYTAFAGLGTQDYGSYMVGGATTKNERALECLDVIRAEIVDMARNAVSDEELEKGKDYLVFSYPLRFDTSGKIAGELLQIQRDGRTLAWLGERNVRIRAMTRADAQRAAQALLGDGQLSVVMVGRPVL